MATISKIHRQSGVRFKVLIKDRTGRVLKSKTFTTKTLAREWAKRIEANREKMEVLGMRGASMTFANWRRSFSHTATLKQMRVNLTGG